MKEAPAWPLVNGINGERKTPNSRGVLINLLLASHSPPLSLSLFLSYSFYLSSSSPGLSIYRLSRLSEAPFHSPMPLASVSFSARRWSPSSFLSLCLASLIRSFVSTLQTGDVREEEGERGSVSLWEQRHRSLYSFIELDAGSRTDGWEGCERRSEDDGTRGSVSLRGWRGHSV